MEDTAVKIVTFLNKAMPSSCSGMFSACVKMVVLTSPVIDDSMHRYSAFEFCTALGFVRLILAVSISRSEIEWYAVNISLLLILVIPVSPVAFHLPLFARSFKLIMNVGNVAMLPSHLSIRGFEISSKACIPDLVERSNASLAWKRS